jgi:hypothetical protein
LDALETPRPTQVCLIKVICPCSACTAAIITNVEWAESLQSNLSSITVQDEDWKSWSSWKEFCRVFLLWANIATYTIIIPAIIPAIIIAPVTAPARLRQGSSSSCSSWEK